MTTPTEQPPRGAMSKPVLIAGVLGGALGAVLSFALARAYPAPVKEPAPQPVPTSEIRPYADDLVKLLKARKNEEFLKAVRPGFAELTDEQFDQGVKQPLLAMRENFDKTYGPGIDFEFLRENALGPNVVRFAYLEKFPRGCVVWILVFYNGPDGWKVVGFRYMKLENAFEYLR